MRFGSSLGAMQLGRLDVTRLEEHPNNYAISVVAELGVRSMNVEQLTNLVNGEDGLVSRVAAMRAELDALVSPGG